MIDLFVITFAIFSILSFRGVIYYKDPDYPNFFRFMCLVNGIGFGLGAISGYTGWF